MASQEIRLVPRYSLTICFAFAASLLAAFTADVSRAQADPWERLTRTRSGNGKIRMRQSGHNRKKTN